MSGTARIEAGLSGNPVDPSDPKDVGYFTNRILVPLLRQIRSTLNRLTGTTKLTTSNVTLDGSEGLVAIDATGAPTIVALPQPTALFHPLVIVKIDSSANSVTISPPPGVKVNGAASEVLAHQWDAAMLEADDSSYYDGVYGAISRIDAEITTIETELANLGTNLGLVWAISRGRYTR